MDVEIARGEWCPELSLEPNVVSTVTFTDEDVATIEVIVTDNTAPVRWTCDGSTPGPEAGYWVPTTGVDERQPPTSGPTRVRLWTTGTALAVVQRG